MHHAQKPRATYRDRQHEFWQSHRASVPELHAADGYGYIMQTFSNPLFFVLYIIWLIALWFHLTHGFWSAMQTLGWNNMIWINRWKCISNIYSTIIVLGFMVVAVVFFLKNMMGCGAC